MQRNEIGSLAHTMSPKFTQNGSQIKAKTIKLLGGHTGAHLYDLGLGGIFLDMIPQHKQPKKKQINYKINKLDT